MWFIFIKGSCEKRRSCLKILCKTRWYARIYNKSCKIKYRDHKQTFETLRKKNAEYQYFSFEGREAKAIAGDDFIGDLYLLFSN